MIIEIIIGFVLLVLFITISAKILELIGWVGMKIFKSKDKVDGFVDIGIFSSLFALSVWLCYMIGYFVIEIIK